MKNNCKRNIYYKYYNYKSIRKIILEYRKVILFMFISIIHQ